MPRGGKRAGSGPKTVAPITLALDEGALERFAVSCANDLPLFYDAIKELALKGDKQALMFLIEHGKGKAAQQAQVSRDYTIILNHQVPRPNAASRSVAHHDLLPDAALPGSGDGHDRGPEGAGPGAGEDHDGSPDAPEPGRPVLPDLPGLFEDRADFQDFDPGTG